jgi:hypothetical protein
MTHKLCGEGFVREMESLFPLCRYIRLRPRGVNAHGLHSWPGAYPRVSASNPSLARYGRGPGLGAAGSAPFKGQHKRVR